MDIAIHIIDTIDDIAEGIAYLHAVDPKLADAIAIAGELPLRRREPGLEGLLSIIVAQQLSVASANAIWSRFKAACGSIDAASVLAMDEALMRSCGLSGPKIRTFRSIAASIDEKALDLDGLQYLSADEAHAAMVKVKGIGPWTADIYLMFCLGHADAFASGDLALQEALKLAYGLDARPGHKELLRHAECWRPWRSIAARLLWAYYKVVKSREGISA